MAVTAGQIFPGYPHLQVEGNKSAAAWAAGDALYTASNAWLKTPTTATTAPFGVAAKAQASGDAKGAVILQGVVAMTAGATIGVHKLVQSDTTTAGRVMAWAGTIGEACIGLYLGKPTEMDGKTVQTSLLAAEVGWILLMPGGGG